MKHFCTYINAHVNHQSAQPPALAPEGRDGLHLTIEDPALRILTTQELLDSYESWRTRMRWLATIRRNQR